MKMNCEPTVESISEKISGSGQGDLTDIVRTIMRKNCASAVNQGSENNQRLKLLRYWTDMERPAYEITGKMERKIYNLKDGEYGINAGIAKGYETAIKVAKQERRQYWINKLLGRLKKPNIYATDKDSFRYASTGDEKTILTQMIQGMDKETKSDLIRILYSNQEQKNLIQNYLNFSIMMMK